MKKFFLVIAAAFASHSLFAAPPPKAPTVGDTYVLNSGTGTSQQLCDQYTTCPANPMLLGSITVPAGSYTVTAKLNFAWWASTTVAQSWCYLYADANLVDATYAHTSVDIQTVPGSLQYAGTFSSQTTLSLKCFNDNGLTAAQNWHLMATKIGALNAQ
jgi:hypothetical protein